jgi:hypothetical protein
LNHASGGNWNACAGQQFASLVFVDFHGVGMVAGGHMVS